MALKKSELYSSLWQSCDELRGGMDASQYKDYVLVLLFMKYVSDKYAGETYAPIAIPKGASFTDLIALKGKSDIGDQINKKIVAPLTKANKLSDFPDFNDASKLGSGKEMVERLTNLIAIFENPALDFSSNRADDDDILGDAYEYLMRHFATESGKSKGQFYTPSEVSRIMAKIVGIADAKTSASTTVYDPTCGSGSLLLKVGEEAGTEVTLYGQEKDAATSGLARMNMILHNNPTALIVQGNTLADPKFEDAGKLKTFDFVVANPPFSDKRWSTGIDLDDDPHERFESFGTPPAKQGDYAYLLHIVRSLMSTGQGACILPHGVLFRGNAEADIRRALVRKGYIKGIIGLPANLFYGTGIPACVVVIDKAGAAKREGIFMVDASGGFQKDGPKNRLRSQDLHKIVDVFNRQIEEPRYARLVPFEEIEKNAFNLNLPRYIDSQTPEDLQDIVGHLQGGIPVADVDALDRYWSVCPSVRDHLFRPNREGYVDLTVEKAEIKSAIYDHPEFASFLKAMKGHFVRWRNRREKALKNLKIGAHPKEVIAELSEDLLAHYADRALVDPYDIYQHLMEYWAESMQDDCYLVAADGWKAETYRVLVEDKKGKVKDKGWACDLVPRDLVVNRFCVDEKTAVERLVSELESLESKLSEVEEEHGSDDGALSGVSTKADALAAREESALALFEGWEPSSYKSFVEATRAVSETESRLSELAEKKAIDALRNQKGNVTKAAINARLKEAIDPEELGVLKAYVEIDKALATDKRERKKWLDHAGEIVRNRLEAESEAVELEEIRTIDEFLALTAEIATNKKDLKAAELRLDTLAHDTYPKLSESEVQSLVVEDKWLATLEAAIDGEMDRVNQGLTRRVKELAERYETPLPEMADRVAELEAKVNQHLERMGFEVS